MFTSDLSPCSFAVPCFSFTQVMVQGCTSLSYEHNESRVLPSHPSSSFDDRATTAYIDGCDGCETKESSMTLWSTPSTTTTTDAGSIPSPETGDRVTAPAMAAASTKPEVEATAVKVYPTLLRKVNNEEPPPSPNYLHLPTCDLKEVVTPFPDLANSMNTMPNETPKDMPTTPSLARYETCRLSAEIPSVDVTYVYGIHSTCMSGTSLSTKNDSTLFSKETQEEAQGHAHAHDMMNAAFSTNTPNFDVRSMPCFDQKHRRQLLADDAITTYVQLLSFAFLL